MKEQIINQIIHNSLITEKEIEQALKHPIQTNYLRPRPEIKILGYTLANFFRNNAQPRIEGIYGPFASGKTTLLWHMAAYAFKNYSKQIYFFDLDTILNLNISLSDLINKLSELKPQSYKVFIFDNIHLDSNWANAIMTLYQNQPNAFIIFAGSNQILGQISNQISDKLFLLNLLPLHFPTYLSLKYTSELPEQQELLKNLPSILFDQQSAIDVANNLEQLKNTFNNYFAQFIALNSKLNRYLHFHNLISFLPFENENYALNGIYQNFKNALQKEALSKNLDSNTIKLLEKITTLTATLETPTIKSIAQYLNIEPQKVENLITDHLQLMGILNLVYPYVKGNEQLAEHSAKVFFVSPNLRLAILNRLKLSHNQTLYKKIYEDITLQYLNQLFSDTVFYLPQQDNNTAFVIDAIAQKPILVYINNYTPQTYQINFRYKIQIDPQATLYQHNNDTIILPLTWFLIQIGFIL